MPPSTLARFEDDEDDHSDHGDSPAEGGNGAGGGKGKSASQARKAQNRVAQREFRQRKQQYIRDLEARVEVLSGDKEERIELVMLLVRNLLKENKDLRGMIQQMAGFLGEGLGSCLPRLGLSASQLDALLNRADTDTAYEAFVKLRASREQEEANPGIPFGEIKRKAPLPKRKRDSLADGQTLAGDDSARTGSADGTPDFKPAKSARGDDPSMAGGSGSGSNEQVNYADAYSYLFPDSAASGSGAADWARYQSGSGDAQNYPASPLGQVRDTQSQMQQQWNYAPPPEQQVRGMFPLGGPMYQQQMPMWGPFGAMTGDLSGFGLTLPPGQPMSQSMSSLAGSGVGPPGGSGDNYAVNHPPTSVSAPNSSASGPSHGAKASAMPDLSARDQERLKQAVTMMVQSKGVTDGPAMSAEEIEERMRVQRKLIESFREDDGLRKRIEPMQLIAYHLNNFRVNHAYILPPSMRPTAVQRTIPHEHAIDGVPFPSIRDRMILLRGRYDLVEAYQGMLLEMVLRGDDPLDHRNWEFSEKWLHDFPILADEEVYAISNRWRAERGEPPLARAEQRG